MSPTIQLWAMRVVRFQFILLYVPGKYLQVSDTLNRDPLNSSLNTDYLDHLEVCLVTTNKKKEERLQKEIDIDSAL